MAPANGVTVPSGAFAETTPSTLPQDAGWFTVRLTGMDGTRCGVPVTTVMAAVTVRG